MIREATEQDAEAISNLLPRDMREGWSAAWFAQLVADPQHSLVVSDVRGINGFSLIHPRGRDIEHTFCWPPDMGRVLNAELVDYQAKIARERGWLVDGVTEFVYASYTPELDEYARIEFGARKEGSLIRGVLLQEDIDRVKEGRRLSAAERQALGR